MTRRREFDAPGAHGAVPGEPGSAPVPTVEEIWERHREDIEAWARGVLGDDPRTLGAACYRALVAAAEEIAGTPSSAFAGDLRPWLERVTLGACREVRRQGAQLRSPPVEALPGAVPFELRAHLQLRAITEQAAIDLERHGARGEGGRAWLAERHRLREAYERWRRGLAAALLFPRRAWRKGRHNPRAPRGWHERAEVLAGPGAAGAAPRLASFIAIAGPGFTEVAVVVTAVALGLGGATSLSTPAPATPLGQAVTASSASHPGSGSAPEITPGALEAASDTAPAHAGEQSQTPAPAPVAGAPTAEITALQPSPVVEAEAESAGDSPVKQDSYDRDYYGTPGSSYETPSTRVVVDADGDGDPEASVDTPYVFVDCPEPERRGVVMGTACPALEESGIGQ